MATTSSRRALAVNDWVNLDSTGINHKMFRNAVRLFNGENLWSQRRRGKLSATKGITIGTENMVYIWGNYNTTGINAPPQTGRPLGTIPSTWLLLPWQPGARVNRLRRFLPHVQDLLFDSETRWFPDDFSKRSAIVTDFCARDFGPNGNHRGNNLSALAGSPDAGNSGSGESRLCGGMHNFPASSRIVGPLEFCRVFDPLYPLDPGCRPIQR
jgi:hypothetical protein